MANQGQLLAEKDSSAEFELNVELYLSANLQSLDKHGNPLSPLANIWDKHGRLVCSLVGWLSALSG